MLKNGIVRSLRAEVEELQKENLRLFEENLALERRIFNLFGGELEEMLSDELDLSPCQRAKLGLLCSIENARNAGVPEDKILHNLDEVDEFFSSRES